MFEHRAEAVIGLVAVLFGLSACATYEIAPEDEPSAVPVMERSTQVSPGAARSWPGGFQIWDMHGSGMQPERSRRVLDPAVAEQGYWLSSSYLAMPKPTPNHRIGVGVTLDEADLDEQARAFEERILRSGISGFRGMVMLDAEAFQPWESPKALAWYNNAARIASRHFENWFWYYQPHRMAKAVPSKFADREAYLGWFARQEFIQRAPALSVTVYHGRDEDAEDAKLAATRVARDRNLDLTAELSRMTGKPLIVTVRADTVALGRGKKLSPESLRAAWMELAKDPDVDGIAVWQGQPKELLEADRRWAEERINPVLREVQREATARVRRADQPAPPREDRRDD